MLNYTTVPQRNVERRSVSVVGLAIKLRLLAMLDPPDDDSFPTKVFNGIVADAERLAGST